MKLKRVSGPGYNLVFDAETGFLARWGNTREENPVMCPIGPEIADIEISTVCHGIGRTMEERRPCVWCYKSNTGKGINMSLETFTKVFSLFPRVLTQIALGIGDIDSNPDFVPIMQHCRQHDVVPNVTVNGMGVDDAWAQLLARLCGAVAVSHYQDELCFDTVQRLSQAGLKQVNIHQLLSSETYESCFRLIDAAASDERLRGLKAIVFLMLKPKGRRNSLTRLGSLEHYGRLLEYAKEKGVAIGMDSCSAPLALKCLPPETIPSIEPCESSLFSIYVNAKGELFPCSFTEGTEGWETGIDLLTVADFGKEVWHSPRLEGWRQRLLGSSAACSDCAVKQHCRSCPIYDITPCRSKGG